MNPTPGKPKTMIPGAFKIPYFGKDVKPVKNWVYACSFDDVPKIASGEKVGKPKGKGLKNLKE